MVFPPHKYGAPKYCFADATGFFAGVSGIRATNVYVVPAVSNDNKSYDLGKILPPGKYASRPSNDVAYTAIGDETTHAESIFSDRVIGSRIAELADIQPK